MKSLFLRSAAAFSACILLFVSVFTVCAEKADAKQDTANYLPENQIMPGGYEEYLRNQADDAHDAAADTLVKSTGLNKNKEEYNGKEAVILQKNDEAVFTFKTDKNARYNIVLCYMPLVADGSDIYYQIKIDGKTPFSECEKLRLKRFWQNSGEKRTDSAGNEFAPKQTGFAGYYTDTASDINGILNAPYTFVFTKGEHTVSVTALSSGIALSEVSLETPESAEPYVKPDNSDMEYGGDTVFIEGEDALYKSSRSLTAKSDNASMNVFPSSAFCSKLNYIGGSSWKTAGDTLIWEFETGQEGYYKIGFAFKQSEVINGTAYRELRIDGKIPFEEAGRIRFDYSSKWQFKPFGGDDGEYLLWLDKGKHTLSLKAVMGDFSEIYTELKRLTLEIGNLYLKIIMITGETPDANRDYDLFRQIDGFNETLQDFEARINEITAEMQRVSGQKSNQYIANFQNMSRILRAMIDNRYTAQNYLSDYYTQYTALGSGLTSMAEMPLSLDRIQICAADKEFEQTSASVFERLKFSVQRFFISFSEDYSKLYVGEKSDRKSIKIWINWGRDQAMVLNDLISESFTAETEINVDLQLTNASLIKGILSGNQPDLALQVARSDVINYALRGAVYDLKSFGDLDSVTGRFGSTAFVPYNYKNGTFALPDTQSFYMLFYRTDIFERLNLSVPQTWEEFLKVTSKLARNNMTVYVPAETNMFTTILQQMGGKVYNEEGNASTLRDSLTLRAFRFWSNMYTEYKIPTAQSFYNRFKVGTCPMGIEKYTMYTQFSEAAGEIDGCWAIAGIPGFKGDGGEIRNECSATGTGCVILSKSRNKNEAWEFLKWWTRADIQLDYNNNVEAVLGTISRNATATYDAFDRMSWDSSDLEIMQRQRDNIAEVREVPGSYYYTRAVDQAFWQVIDGVYNAKDVLYLWGESADKEIARKIEEYE